MGVELTLWALNEKEKTFTVFPLERRSAVWNTIKEFSSQKVLCNLDEFKGVAFCYKSSTKKRQKPSIKKIEYVHPLKKDLLVDCYGNPLQTIKAIDIHILILEGLIDFLYNNNRLKETFLKLNNNTNIVLYWH